MTSHYRLGINGLTSSEIALVQMLLRLAAHHREVHWICADQAPWHAVLLDDPDDERLDHGGLEAVLPGLGRDTPYVLRLTGAGSVRRAGAMRRPIRGEKLLAWLDRVEAALAGETDAIEPGASAPQSRTAPDTLVPGAPRRRLLRRLPASLVRNSAERHRMARLLARYALNAQDLHRLSGVAPVECLVFLKVLDAHQLLSPAPAARPYGDVAPADVSAFVSFLASRQQAAAARPGLARRLASGVFRRPGP